jgi:lactadherin
MPGYSGWLATTSDFNTSWIQVDLKKNKLIGGIVTLGRTTNTTNPQYVTKFRITYRSEESDSFTEYVNTEGNEVSAFDVCQQRIINTQFQTFIGNTINYEPIFNGFNAHFLARYVRLYPLAYRNWPTLRWELYACKQRECRFSYVRKY